MFAQQKRLPTCGNKLPTLCELLRDQAQCADSHWPSAPFARSLWECSTHVSVARTLRVVDHKDDILLGLQLGHDGPVGVLVRDRDLVDSRDDRTLAEVDLVREGAWPHAGDHDASGGGEL